MVDPTVYSYTYPEALVAHEPAEPRDAARLFVYDTARNVVTYATCRDLPAFVPPALVVRNTTAVVPARLTARRSSGEEIELFVLYDRGVIDGCYIEAMVNRGLKPGEIVSVGAYEFAVVDTSQKQIRFALRFPGEALLPLLREAGATPVPPYLRPRATEQVLRERYQTVFAEDPGSVAAPTASLHFTPELCERLTRAGSEQVGVTLNIGLGTFAPLTPERLATGHLHHESYRVPEATAIAISRAKRTGRPVLAIGTTVVRTLEAAAAPILAGAAAEGDTDLFIYPPYPFALTDMLMTNFHVPGSSLMCLVDAFLLHKGAARGILSLYEEAIAEGFRLFSFGDAMLIR